MAHFIRLSFFANLLIHRYIGSSNSLININNKKDSMKKCKVRERNRMLEKPIMKI